MLNQLQEHVVSYRGNPFLFLISKVGGRDRCCELDREWHDEDLANKRIKEEGSQATNEKLRDGAQVKHDRILVIELSPM